MRKTFPAFLLLVVILHAWPKSAQAKPAAAAAGSRSVEMNPGPRSAYDSNQVRTLYQDGDFDKAIAILEAALKGGNVVSHGDSVFVFKHLGVMYAANDNSRERGKYYMFQLLTIEPTARIMDMYASDMIYMIFRNIQEEYATSHQKYVRAEKNLAGNQALNAKTPPPKGNAPPDAPRPGPKAAAKTGHLKTYLWMGAAAAMIGAGVTLYVLTNDEPATTDDYEVK
jgi:hypothetical protein